MAYTFALSLILLFASSVHPCREVVHLDFGSARAGVPVHTTHLPGHIGVPCDPQRAVLICTDVSYPQDVYCDVGRIRLHPTWPANASIEALELSYDHPSARGTVCMARLTQSSVGEGSVYTFAGAECSTAVEDETLPGFSVSRLLGVKVMTQQRRVESTTSNYFHHEDECSRKNFKFAGARVHGASKGGRRRWVTFDLDYSYCLSYTTTFVGGRMQVTTAFTHDGRRFRPTTARLH